MPRVSPRLHRLFLLAVGAVGAAVHIGWLVATLRTPTPIDIAWAVGWGGALLGGLVKRARPVLGAVAAIGAWLAATWSQDAVSFPYVDIVRPWGMDWDPYPVLRPPLGVALLLLFVPTAISAGWAARNIACRVLTLGLLAGLGAWWATPHWFEMDLIAKEGVFEQVPTWMPQPGTVGAGDTPAVVGGALRHVHWTEYGYQAEPWRALRYIAHRELALGALAHGMHLELSPDAGAIQRRVRAGAWRVAGGVSTGWLYAHLAALPILALLVVGGSFLPFPRLLARLTIAVPILLCVVPPIVNLAMLGVLGACGLHDIAGATARVLVESLALLACVGALEMTGRALLPKVRRDV